MTGNGAGQAVVNIDDRLPVIGVGGSAGALNALYAFFDAMPTDLGAAIVVILHLDPHHSSNLAELLARHTAMPVRSAEDGMAVEANSVYVIPPGAALRIGGGIFRLSERKDHAPQMLVDVFLRALAEHSRERAACIILSGTGTDGTLGLRAIKEKGGLAIVQDPSEASHNGMPCSAIASASADLILPVREMPEAIRTYMHHPYAKHRPGVGVGDITVRDRLDQFVAVLARKSPHDFRGYKEGTLLRRIERRMALRRTLSVDGYLQLLGAEENEAKQLAKDLLINVTSFFRDPQAFNYLAETALPEMLTRRGDNDEPVRVWVPGCSTGEEAYSLAILLTEVLGTLRSTRRFQVFASDVDEDALSFAREGIYPESIAADVSPERLRRFFVHENHAYCVAPDVRETVAFATHNVLMDSPFSRLDLISCRNVLIYLKADVQERLLRLFHFALIPDGLLCLGTSETAATQRELFQPLSPRTERVYRRVGSSHPPGVRMPMPRGEDGRTRWSDAISGLQAARQRDRLQERARDLALDAFAPASVVVNPRYEALYFFGPTDRYLQVPSGEASRSVLDLAREGLRLKLRVALQKTFAEKQPVSIRGATIKRNGEAIRVVIRGQPFGWDSETLALISLTDEPPADRDHPVDHAKQRNGVGSVRDLERELEETRTELQETIRELEMANAALQTVNDEATSMNEEFLTANEELETSKEELQSVNEELTTLNFQLQQQAEKYRKTADDLHNLLVSSEVATVFLDKDWRIKRFTPALRRLVNIIDTDIGRPFADLSPRFDDPQFLDDAREVLTDHAPKVREVRCETGEVYTRRILPYRTDDDRIDGVVITFVDITELKQAEDALADSKASAVRELRELETLYQTAPIGLSLLDADLRFLRINETLAEINGVPVAVHLGRTVRDVLPKLAPVAEPLLRRVLETGEPIHDIEIQGETPQQPGVKRTWLEQFYPLKSDDGSVLAVGAIVREITEQKRAEAALRDSEARFRTVVDTAADGIITIDQHGIIEFANTQAERLFGYQRGELIGRSINDLMPEAVQGEHDGYLARYLRTGEGKAIGATRELAGRRKDGSNVPISVSVGEFQINEKRYFTGIMRDITERKQAEAELRDRTARYELVAAGAHDAIWDWDVLNHRVFFSPRWKKMRGFAPDEVGDREEEWSANIHPDDAPRVMAAVRAHFEGKSEVFAEEYRIRCKDGSWKWVLDRGIALRDADGRVIRMAGSETDITERKRSETALRQSEERLRRFVDAAPVAIAMFDRDMRYIAASQRFMADYRLDDQELAGRSHYDVFPEIPQRWREIHQRCLQGAVERSAGDRFQRADGSVDWIRWEIQPWYDAAGEIGGIILFSEDITDFMRAQEDLRHATAKVEQANRLKEDFLLAISHDIRQPLQTLSFLQEVLAKKLADPELRKLVASQGASIAAMTESLNTLLDIDRLESGAIEPQLADVAVGPLLTRLRDEFEGRARAKLLDLRIVASSRIVRTDPDLLMRILQNLVSNAIKYTKEGRVLVGCRRRGAMLRIEAWDSGIGIPQQQIERIFEKYQQGSAGMETPRRGFGIGLSIVRHLCRLLGHDMEVRSVVGKGSMFAVSLPATERTRLAAGPEAAEPPSVPHPKTILIVEDDESTIVMLRTLLEPEGIAIIAARSGTEALARIGNEPVPPDVIITSYRLDIPGFEIVQRVRDLTGRQIPAIILTGIAPSDQKAHAVEGVRWLLKPVPSSEIVNLIHQWLGEQAPDERVPEPLPEIVGSIPAGERTPLIHVVDDDARFRTLLATLLESEGFEVAGYPDAESFLSRYRPASDRPECLLLDIVLPQMTGLELQEVLRQRRIDIPTVIITGHSAMRTATQAVLAGAIDVIEKPVRREVLVRVLRHGLETATEQRAAADRQQELAALFEALTVREREVMSLVVSGLANKEIAYRLGISERTIEGHRRAIMQKMKVKSLADLVRAAGTIGNA